MTTSDVKDEVRAEEWRPIRGYYNYSVSNRGRVRNDETFRILKTMRVSSSIPFQRVNLTRFNIKTTYLVHRLVAEYFLDDFNEDYQVTLIDGDASNVYLENIEMSTERRRRLRHSEQRI